MAKFTGLPCDRKHYNPHFLRNIMNNKSAFLKGARDGVPIGLGYFAVSFSLGIIAKKAGLNILEGFFSSLLTRASAGEYAVYALMAAGTTGMEIFVISLITNARYLLMNCALSQKFDEKTGLLQRILVGCCCTDEVFGISIAYPGKLNPNYTYGAMLVAAPLWALGTSLGIVAGSILPTKLVSALSVALYGMFLAIIIPPAKKDRAVMLAIIASFVLSFLFTFGCERITFLRGISGGTRTIILTVGISAVCALLAPRSEVKKEA